MFLFYLKAQNQQIFIPCFLLLEYLVESEFTTDNSRIGKRIINRKKNTKIDRLKFNVDNWNQQTGKKFRTDFRSYTQNSLSIKVQELPIVISTGEIK